MKKLINCILLLLLFAPCLSTAQLLDADKLESAFAVSDNEPWHYYYYSDSKAHMFEGRDSTVKKLSRVMGDPVLKESFLAREDAIEKTNYNKSWWTGRCHALALASMLKPLRECSLSYRGEIFTLLDQRALLSFNNESVASLKDDFFLLGRRSFNSEYKDQVTPYEFHMFLYDYFISKPITQRPSFALDIHSGAPVIWQPVSQVNIVTELISETENNITYEVEAKLKMSEHLFDFDIEKLLQRSIITNNKVFKYRFFLQKDKGSSDQYVVVNQNWLSESPGLAFSVRSKDVVTRPRGNHIPVEVINEILKSPCAE